MSIGSSGFFIYNSLKTLHKSGLFTIVRNPYYQEIKSIFGDYLAMIYQEVTTEGFKFPGGANGFRFLEKYKAIVSFIDEF